MKSKSDRSQPIIILNDVTVRYRSYTEKSSSLKESFLRMLRGKTSSAYQTFDALSGINLEVPKGAVLGIIGSNGSGKSTLLKVLAQVLPPSSGSVDVRGSVASLIELGVAFDPELTAIENIYLHGALHKKSRAQIKDKVERILDFAELTEFAHKPIQYYSSGMVARLGFSCAVDVDPDILIVDEILGVGDERFQKKCSGIFQSFFEKKKTIVIVSHDLTMIAKVATHGLLISEGKINYLGDPSIAVELYRDGSYKTLLKPSMKTENAVATSAEVASSDESVVVPHTKAKIGDKKISEVSINIVTEPAPGWILRKIAVSFAQQIGNNVTVSESVDLKCDINFYINYALFDENNRSACDVGLFTHREKEGFFTGVFDRVAASIDWCVSMNRLNLAYLPAERTDVLLIPPGSQFISSKPLRLGVYTRDNLSGRNRAQWIDELQKIPGIEVIVAGDGPSTVEIEACYKLIDYLLIIVENECGPMPLVEALAQKIPVIAPNAGFVGEYTTLRYETLDELIALIKGLVIPVDAWEIAAQQLINIFNKAFLAKKNSQVSRGVAAL